LWGAAHRNPVVKLRLLRDRGLAVGCGLISFMAFILFSGPRWAAYCRLMGYSAAQSGWARRTARRRGGRRCSWSGRLSR
jgi:hypothetical protein